MDSVHLVLALRFRVGWCFEACYQSTKNTFRLERLYYSPLCLCNKLIWFYFYQHLVALFFFHTWRNTSLRKVNIVLKTATHYNVFNSVTFEEITNCVSLSGTQCTKSWCSDFASDGVFEACAKKTIRLEVCALRLQSTVFIRCTGLVLRPPFSTRWMRAVLLLGIYTGSTNSILFYSIHFPCHYFPSAMYLLFCFGAPQCP